MVGPPPPLEGIEIPTPFGSLAVVGTPEDGRVRASGFWPLSTAALYLNPALAARGVVPGELTAARRAIDAWLAGDGEALNDVPVEQPGGPFTQRVWEAMRRIPAGAVMTYGELAAEAGNGRAARAVGQACARNAVAPFVPCHRVVASTGVGNYGYGAGMKEEMLRLEASPRE